MKIGTAISLLVAALVLLLASHLHDSAHRFDVVWHCFFCLSNGENAERIPKYAFYELAELAGKQFLKAGLFPIAAYFRPTMVQRKKVS